MNKRQKLVQQQFLNNEEAVIKRLKQVYGESYKDITKKVADLDESIAYLQEVYDGIESDGLTGAALDYFASRGQNPSPEQAQETVKSMLQSKVYQKNYQEALQKQVDGILDKMHTNEFKTVSAYLDKCYEDGFIGAMFDLQGQGIPLCFPLDQEAMVRAVQLDSKISKGLYSRMGEDVSMLKKHITAQVSRGVANGMSYEKIAQQIGFKMLGTYDTPGGAYANALRIARTEGHRIQVQGGMDACYKAKEKGADVVKQWDSTLDTSTRESHVHVDGEIRELDKAFSNGLMFPGDPSGGPGEVVNCRCALLQRAKWGLDEAELQTLKDRAEYFGLDKSDTFEEYKKKYLKASKEIEKAVQKTNFTPAKTKEEAIEYAHSQGVKYVEYGNLPIDTINDLNNAITTLPKDARPIFIGDSRNLEKAFYGTQHKLPRKHNQFFGISQDSSSYGMYFKGSDGIYRLNWDEGGQMVGISSVHNTTKKITTAKKTSQEKYRAKYGRDWFFNETGETTAFHEMGHCYTNKYGLPEGFEYVSNAWAEKSKCDMLKKPSEAWAEAWASYHTGINIDKVPEDVLDFIRKASEKQ